MVKLKKIEISKSETIVESKVEEISSEQSSSSLCTVTSVLHEQLPAETKNEETFNIVDLSYASDNDSTKGEEVDNKSECSLRQTLMEDGDFFTNFHAVLDLEDVSISEENDSVKISVIDQLQTTRDGTLSPLTDEKLDMSIKTDSLASEEQVIDDTSKSEVAEEESLVFELEESELSGFVLPEDISETDEKEQKSLDEGDTLQTFLELKKASIDVRTKDTDWQEILASLEEENQLILNNTLNFLNELITKVVVSIEYVSPEKLLIQNLDKLKLLKELSYLIPTYTMETKCCEFLNRQIVTFFRRRSSFRSISADKPKTVKQEKQKFIEATENLDKLLAAETKLLNSTTVKYQNFHQQYEQQKMQLNNLVDAFENSVREHLCRENRPKLNTVNYSLY